MSLNFEPAADAIVNGDVVTLERLLDEEPQLIHRASFTRGYQFISDNYLPDSKTFHTQLFNFERTHA